ILSFGVGIYTYNYMPVLDFLPYKVGNNIPELMKLPPGAAPDVYEIIYTMKHKQSGETRQISDKEYLRTEIWKDPDWEITGDPESRLVQKGYDVKIKDLRIMDSQGTDYTREVLENPYYNLIVVAYDLSKSDEKAIGDLNALAMNAAENFNIRSVLLTSASAKDSEVFS